MKKIWLTASFVIPSIALAGGYGNISLEDYHISTSHKTSSQESSITPTPSSPMTRNQNTVKSALKTRRSSHYNRARRRHIRNYWRWVDAQRAKQDYLPVGVYRSNRNIHRFGNDYELSVGLEPIDPKDNMFRGRSRENERQNAAKLKMLRLRGLR